MPTPVQNTIPGQPVPEIDLVDLFEAEEGSINQYYGRIGQGKTYNATADALADLAAGRVVYLNWHLHYEGFDERSSLMQLLGSLLGLKRRFYRFPKENLRYISIDHNFLDNFEKLTDCKVYLDEGHVAFDSYEMAKMSLRKRQAVLHTRHFNRTICIISQRPTAVHVSMRANVNIFYKCEKLLQWPLLIFRRTEFQDLTGETVDETQPISSKVYFAKKHVLNAYNSKYLRNGMEPSQKVFFEAYDLSYRERLSQFWRVCRSLFPGLSREQGAARAPENLSDFPGARPPLSAIIPKEKKSLGVKPDVATIKNPGGLNTTRVGVEEQQALPF